jgi:DNA repair protein RadC
MARGFRDVAATPDYLGHRSRLRERFMNGGPSALPDYELLELVLFRAFPRADVKPLAKALIRQFGSFAEVISASPARLKEVRGVGDRVVEEIKLVQAAALRLSQGNLINRPALTSWPAVLEYCHASMAYSPKEQFRMLMLIVNSSFTFNPLRETSLKRP